MQNAYRLFLIVKQSLSVFRRMALKVIIFRLFMHIPAYYRTFQIFSTGSVLVKTIVRFSP
jgi:hypothetical protein